MPGAGRAGTPETVWAACPVLRKLLQHLSWGGNSDVAVQNGQMLEQSFSDQG